MCIRDRFHSDIHLKEIWLLLAFFNNPADARQNGGMPALGKINMYCRHGKILGEGLHVLLVNDALLKSID